MIKNKKGVEYTIIISIIVLLIIAAIVIWFNLDFFAKLFGLVEVVSVDKISARAEACKLTLNQNEFCRFIKAGDNFYINCKYSDPNFVASLEDSVNKYECAAGTEQAFCDGLTKDSVINTGECVIDEAVDSDNKYLE